MKGLHVCMLFSLNRKIVIRKFLILFLFVLAFSCNQKTKTDTVSLETNYFHIPFCHSVEIRDSNNLSQKVREQSRISLRQKLGDSLNKLLIFDSARVLSDSSLRIIEKKTMTDIVLYGKDSMTISNSKNCFFPYNYPIYKLYYNLKLQKTGLENINLELTIDNKGAILNNIGFPSYDFNKNRFTLLPIDSVYAEIKRRGIPLKKLNISAWYSKEEDVIFWSVETFLSQGSVLKGGCLPIVEHHFRMNSNNGNIMEYSQETEKAYSLDRFN